MTDSDTVWVKWPRDMDSCRLEFTGLTNMDQVPHLPALTPPSRTHEYKKLMKPLMERKRRARMNVCIEEIRELMASQLSESADFKLHARNDDDDMVSRMDKAEVLEVAVNHIHKQLMRSERGDLVTEAKLFRQGYLSARAVVNRFLSECTSLDSETRHKLILYMNELNLTSYPDVSAPSRGAVNNPATASQPDSSNYRLQVASPIDEGDLNMAQPVRVPLRVIAQPLQQPINVQATCQPLVTQSDESRQQLPPHSQSASQPQHPINLSKSAFHLVPAANLSRNLPPRRQSWRPW